MAALRPAKQGGADAVGIGAVVADGVGAGVRDVLGEAVDPVEGVEELFPLARTGVGRGGDMDASLRAAGDTTHGEGRAYGPGTRSAPEH